MSRHDQLMRQRAWADELVKLMRESESEEDFARRLAFFSTRVTAAVEADRKASEPKTSGSGMNGTALSGLISMAEKTIPLLPDHGPSKV